MPPLSPGEAVINRINAIVFGTIFSILHFLGIAFVAAIGLGIARVIFVTILALIYHFRTRKTTAAADFQPLVSVIVPAFNECKVVGRTIRSVLDGDYQNIEIIFVDDGSNDGTADAVDAEFAAHPKVRVIRQPNGGKASALNNGIGNRPAKSSSDWTPIRNLGRRRFRRSSRTSPIRASARWLGM
jgi:cellulose synthase/poly-beta-1,6-N-acetylglucosamine synthase-like glycosyltransferase